MHVNQKYARLDFFVGNKKEKCKFYETWFIPDFNLI